MINGFMNYYLLSTAKLQKNSETKSHLQKKQSKKKKKTYYNGSTS
jgi:hypothetical protein